MLKNILILFLIVYTALNASAFEDKNAIQFAYGPSTHSLNLNSDAFSASQEFKQGQGLQINYSRFTEDGFLKTEIAYRELNNKYLTSTTLMPSEINVKNQEAEISLLATAAVIDQHKFFRIGLGYAFSKQTADQTKPNVLVVNNEVQVLELKAKYDLYKANDLVINIGIGLGLPFRYTEYAVQSGVNIKSTELNANIDIQYYVSTHWSLLAKVQYTSAVTLADGLGSRGTVNSTEKKQTFFLPIGFSYDF